MKKLILVLLTSTLAAQPIIEFDGESFLVDNLPVQRCLLDGTLKQVQSVEQFDSYVMQGGRVGIVRYGDNEYGLASNGSLNGGGPILGWAAWGVVKAIGLAPDAIARKVAKTKARKDEERVARGEVPRHQNTDRQGTVANKKVAELQGVFDKLAETAREYCNNLPTP